MRLWLNSPFFSCLLSPGFEVQVTIIFVSASYHVILVCLFHVIFPCLPSPSLSLQPEKLIYLPYYHFSCYLIINIIHFGLRFLFQMKDNQLIMSVTLLFQNTFMYYFCFVLFFSPPVTTSFWFLSQCAHHCQLIWWKDLQQMTRAKFTSQRCELWLQIVITKVIWK